MGALRPVHILILLLVVLILFGYKKLPDAARSLGRSMRIFKSEVEEMKKDGTSSPSAASSDTVRGEAFHPRDDSSEERIADPTKRPTSDPGEYEKNNQPPN